VAVKADVPGLVRSSDAGTVLAGLHGPDEVRRGFRSLRETFGGRLPGVIVQPVVTGGVPAPATVTSPSHDGRDRPILSRAAVRRGGVPG